MPCLHCPRVSTTVPSASMNARSKKASGCCPQTFTRTALIARIRI